MAMQHTYATGAATGTRAQYSSIGGTDSLVVTNADATGTVSVVANSSTYGPNAIQLVTSATTSEACRIQTSVTANEFRGHLIFDVPTLTSGQWVDIATVYASAAVGISFNYSGELQLYIGGVQVYTSGTAKIPAAGTRIRISVAFSLTTWRIGLYNDQTETLIASGNGTTSALSGTFGTLFLGKTSWQSGANITIVIRAIRIESGPGAALALLPAESLLTPAKGHSVVPIRFVSYSGAASTPTGATAVTNLADGNTATTVVVDAASSMRLALRPMNVVSSDLTFQFPDVFADSAVTVSVKLYTPDGTQVGSIKTMNITTTAALGAVTFTAAELSGVVSTDWEGMQLEVLIP